MAQFILQGRLKPLFSAGDGILSIGSQIPLRFHNRKFGLHSRNHSTKQVAASSSSRSLSLGKSNIYDSEEASLIVNNNGVNGCGEDTDDEFERDEELTYFRGLVLDISYRPVNVICWKRAICMEFMEKADVLEYYDQIVNSPSGSFYIPAVLRVPHLLQVVKRRRIKNTLSRKNILYRDNFTCQYCSSSENLTIDHILPIALGGERKWENLVTACFKCNSKKGQKTIEEANMKLRKPPKAPKDYEILAIPLTNKTIKMLRLRKETPDEWRQYL